MPIIILEILPNADNLAEILANLESVFASAASRVSGVGDAAEVYAGMFR